MYLNEFSIQRIKCFHDVTLKLPEKDGDHSGWNVILGGNGTGKSTLLQAMAIALTGPLVGQRLLFNPAGWTRKEQKWGEFSARISPGLNDSAIGQPRKKLYVAKFALTGNEAVEVEDETYDQPQIVQLKSDRKGLSTGPYAASRPGWLACGYGPFRRLTGMGGSEEYDLVYAPGRGKRFATLFREGAAITNGTEWLVSLYTRSIDPHEADQEKIANDLHLLQKVINNLLPGGVTLARVDAKNVYFQTIGGVSVTVPELSDGYRSFLALAIDLLRHIHDAANDFSAIVQCDGEIPRITMDGVVLIDEVDAHLHPRWQRQIGFRLCQAFPKLQFIVTSHSPFVAQAANDHGLFVMRQPKGYGFVEAIQPVRSVRGWRVDQVLTDRMLFDLEGTRDEQTEQLMEQHRQLAAKREWGQLTAQERDGLIRLEQELSDVLTAPGETVESREREQSMQRYVNETLAELKGHP